MSGSEAPIRAGNTLPIRNIPVGSTIHCIELKPGAGAQIARSAGASATLLAREGVYAQVRMRSGEVGLTLMTAIYAASPEKLSSWPGFSATYAFLT